MATWYFDAVNGLDTNDGKTLATPKQWWNNFSQGTSAAGDTFLFKRGTTQVVSTPFVSFRSGASDTAKSRFAVYGSAGVSYMTWINPAAAGGQVIVMAGRQYMQVEDMHFDGGNVNSIGIYAAVQGATDAVGHTFLRCHIRNNLGSGLNVGIEGGKTGTPGGHLIEDCEFYDNGGHGVIWSGVNNSVCRRSKFYRNGALVSTGGHGFSSGAGKTVASSGWTVVASTTIWQRTLAVNETDVYYVMSNVSPYWRLRVTAGTPSTPNPGEFGVSGGVLYINVNSASNPSGQSIIYAWKRAYGLVIEDCEAYENIWNKAAPYHEGHGFAFDDWTDFSIFRRNKSYNNQGAGFSVNRGDGNLIHSNIAYGNWLSAVLANPNDGLNIKNNTFFSNNAGSGATAGEIFFTGYSSNAVISNNILLPAVSYGISRETSDTGFTGTKNCIFGHTVAAQKNPFLTSTENVDPKLDSLFRPRALKLIRSGANLGGKDFYGKPFYSAPNIGAVEDETATPRYVFRT